MHTTHHEHLRDTKSRQGSLLLAEPILKEYSSEDIEIFIKDIFLVTRIAAHIDKDYGEHDNPDTENDIRKFKKLLLQWEKKYKDIVLKFKITGIECKLLIYVQDTEERLAGLLKNMKGFSRLNYHPGKIEGEFSEGLKVTNTVTFSMEEGMLKMIYSKEDILDEKSPEIRVCIFYGLKGGFDKTISLQDYADTFSFDLSPELSMIRKGKAYSLFHHSAASQRY